MAAGSFSGRRVYVTGATGFIGGHVTRRLLAEGADVTALVRPTTDASHLEKDGVTVHRGNVTEPDTIRPEGHDIVIHTAAWVGMGVPPRKRAIFWETNVDAVRLVLEAARDAGVPRAVHVSSIAALGNTGNVIADESFQRGAGFKSYYEETKVAAHRIATEMTGIDVAVPMPGVVLGHGYDWDPIFRRWVHGRLRALPSDDAPTGFVHVHDVADGILLAALKGKGPYLLVDQNLTFQQLFLGLENVTGIPAPRRLVPTKVFRALGAAFDGVQKLRGKQAPMAELVNGLETPMRYSSRKARDELGWHPDLFRHLAGDVETWRREGA